jgi:hypothetical protein
MGFREADVITTDCVYCCDHNRLMVRDPKAAHGWTDWRCIRIENKGLKGTYLLNHRFSLKAFRCTCSKFDIISQCCLGNQLGLK